MSTPTMSCNLSLRPIFRYLLRLSVWPVLLLFCNSQSRGQTLAWGIGGAGGSGTWDTVASHWFDGTQNVVWPSNGNAAFSGASGSVNVASSGIVANSIIFNTAGYLIQNGRVLSGPGGLTINTNADATISSTLDNSVSAGNSLAKTGPAALIVSGTNFIGSVNVDQGEYRVNGSSSLFFSDVTIANDPSAIVTLGQSGTAASIGSLSGGGPQGGIVQPDNQARTVTLALRGQGSFAGTLQDNGNGKLGLQLLTGGNFNIITSTTKIVLGTFTGTGNVTLTAANTNSGATTIDSGNLVLSGNGSMVNSPVTSSSLGLFVIDNSSATLANRVSDTLPFTMENTRVQVSGNSATPVEEFVGNAVLSGASSLTITKPGSATTRLTFSGFTRNAHATLNIVGDGVAIGGLANDSAGILPTGFTVGNDWAMIGADGRITNFSGYATDITAGLLSDHVKVSASGTTSLAASATRASLNLQNTNSTVDQTLDLGGHSLSLTSGGLLESGNGSSTIRNGAILTLTPEMIVTANNVLSISSAIQQQISAATSLVKTGPGTLTLSGANAYAGNTAILQGTLIAGSDANLGIGSNIEFGGGTLLAANNFSSSKGLMKTSPLVGTIDTGGFNIAFSGPNTGAINKIGLGTLTLSNANTGTTFVTDGTLALTNPTSGNVTLRGGKLQAAGTLSKISFVSTPTPNFVLDLGGPAAATLTTTVLDNGFQEPFTIDFGIGSAAKDLWSITNSSFLSGPIAFEFANLGGVTTGVDYTLITFPSASGPFLPSAFSLAPDMAAAGWAGTFKTTNTSVSVRFTAVPALGDFNRDGHLTVADVQAMLAALTDLNSYKSSHGLSDVGLLSFGDIDHSGAVTNADLQVLLNLLISGGGSSAVVPEPASLVLMALGGILMLRSWRNRIDH